MSTLTATADDANGVIHLYVEFTTPVGTPQYAIVERVHPDGTVHTVRGGDPVTLVGTPPAAVLTDAEAPIGVAVTYRAYAVAFPATVVTSGAVTLAATDDVWLKDPARPWANIRADFCVQGSPTCVTLDTTVAIVRFGASLRTADAGLFPILDAPRPVDVWGRRKDRETGIRFLSRTLAAIDQVDDLFTAGGPLFIQVPPVYGWPDRYYQPGDLTEDYAPGAEDQRKPYRVWDTPLVVVDAPATAGGQQGTACANWCAIYEAFPTSAALAATGDTWQDVADGSTLC